MARWLKVLLGVLVVTTVVYVVLVVYEVGSVTLPKYDAVKPENLKLLGEKQGWSRPDDILWFHHASQGTRILPYDWFINLEKPTIVPSGKIIDPGYLERFGFLTSKVHPTLNPHGLPVGFAREDHFDAPYANPPSTGPVVGLTCAACHTGQITYRDEKAGNVLKGIRVEGGSAMINLSAFQEDLGRAIAFTLGSNTRFDKFAKGVLKDQGSNLGATEWSRKKEELQDQLQQFLDAGLSSREYARIHKLDGTDGGFGRTDALGLIGNRVFVALGNENLTVPTGPVNFPPLWDTSWFDWVQYNASIRMPMVRNIGEALGVGATVNLNEQAGPPSSTGKPLFDSTVNVQNLYLIEEQIGGSTELAGLQSPKLKDTELWDDSPEADELRTLGKPLYTKYCQACHLAPVEDLKKNLDNPENWSLETVSGKHVLKLKTYDLQEIGTDPNQAMNFYRRVAVFEGQTISATLGLYEVTEFIREANYKRLGLNPEQVLAYNRYRKFDPGDEADVKSGKAIKGVLVANLKYKARPLDGVWATPPYLHNGAVPNLHQMLLPADYRDKKFTLGTTLYDKKHAGFFTEEFSGGFLLDTSLPGNSNAGHEYRNLTLDELERAKGIFYPDSDTIPTKRKRWITVLDIDESKFDKLTPAEAWEEARKATAAALEIDWVKRDHPFKGVLGPEFREGERKALLEYVKSL